MDQMNSLFLKGMSNRGWDGKKGPSIYGRFVFGSTSRTGWLVYDTPPSAKERNIKPSLPQLSHIFLSGHCIPSISCALLYSTLLHKTHTSNLTTMTASSAVLGWSYGRTGKINESGILDLPLHFINFFSGFIFHDVIDDEKNGRRESLLN